MHKYSKDIMWGFIAIVVVMFFLTGKLYIFPIIIIVCLAFSLGRDESQYYDIFTQLFKCHNYFFLSENDLHPIVLMYAIYYDFIYMVKFLSKDKNMNETLKISLFITFNNVLN